MHEMPVTGMQTKQAKRAQAYAQTLDHAPYQSAQLISVQDGQVYALGPQSCWIGREAGTDGVAVHEKTVSRKHAVITWEAGDYWLKDNHSRNGTFLNGEKLKSDTAYALSHEDRIEAAKFQYIFRVQQRDEEQLQMKGLHVHVEIAGGRKQLAAVLPKGRLSGYQQKICENNRMKGILEAAYVDAGEQLLLYYEIDGLKKLDSMVLRGELGAEQSLRLMLQITETIQSLPRYLLPESNLVLRPDMIFVDASGKTALLYLPLREESLEIRALTGRVPAGADSLEEKSLNGQMSVSADGLEEKSLAGRMTVSAGSLEERSLTGRVSADADSLEEKSLNGQMSVSADSLEEKSLAGRMSVGADGLEERSFTGRVSASAGSLKKRALEVQMTADRIGDLKAQDSLSGNVASIETELFRTLLFALPMYAKELNRLGEEARSPFQLGRFLALKLEALCRPEPDERTPDEAARTQPGWDKLHRLAEIWREAIGKEKQRRGHEGKDERRRSRAEQEDWRRDSAEKEVWQRSIQAKEENWRESAEREAWRQGAAEKYRWEMEEQEDWRHDQSEKEVRRRGRPAKGEGRQCGPEGKDERRRSYPEQEGRRDSVRKEGRQPAAGGAVRSLPWGLLVQIPVLGLLAGVYASHLLKPIDFLGFSIITAALDVWSVKTWKKPKSKSA